MNEEKEPMFKVVFTCFETTDSGVQAVTKAVESISHGYVDCIEVEKL